MTALATFQNAYRATVDGLIIPVPEGTFLYTTAMQILDMCRAYADDSATFADRGDLVNAMASCAYGGGWVDAALAYGLLTTKQDHASEKPAPESVTSPMAVIVGTYTSDAEPVHSGIICHLIEKTTRYEGMLNDAIIGVKPAPDHATEPFMFAMTAITSAEEALFTGNDADDSLDPGALAWYSYGYGWLDMAVRAGMLRVSGNRSLFTI